MVISVINASAAFYVEMVRRAISTRRNGRHRNDDRVERTIIRSRLPATGRVQTCAPAGRDQKAVPSRRWVVARGVVPLG